MLMTILHLVVSDIVKILYNWRITLSLMEAYREKFSNNNIDSLPLVGSGCRLFKQRFRWDIYHGHKLRHEYKF